MRCDKITENYVIRNYRNRTASKVEGNIYSIVTSNKEQLTVGEGASSPLENEPCEKAGGRNGFRIPLFDRLPGRVVSRFNDVMDGNNVCGTCG